MGFASASREEKLKMMKTSHTRKTTRKLNRLGKNKKLSRGVINELKKIKARRCKDSRERIVNIEDDWIAEREWHFNNGAEGILPLDMLDADINWENSSFAGIKRRHDQKFESGALITSNANRDIEKNKRNFEGHLDENFEEMLPIKLKDGRILRPVREKDLEADQDDSKWINSREEVKTEFESFSELSAAELLIKRKEMIHQYKQSISNSSQELLTSPQENIYKLRDLLGLCQGENVHSLVRETIQKLALISTMQVFVDIVPGYSIREFTEQEKHQKMKKETKKLRVFEETLLRYYLKFLQFCEKKTRKLDLKCRDVRESSFTYKLGILCLKIMSRLVLRIPHFNFSTNILSTLIHLSVCNHSAVVLEVCNTLHQVFHEDLHLRMSLFGVKSIASLVNKRKGYVPPELIATFLSLNIKEVTKDDRKSEKGRIFAKRARLKRERCNKTANKYKKQLNKLEADLKELDAVETISTKLKTATETMKHVFQCYFSVLMRVSNVALFEPVLEGFSKFAHLLGVEYFEDIVCAMENLVDNEKLRLLDKLYCIHTVFVILSGEGQLINIDPSRLYRTVYRLLNQLPFENRPEVRQKQTSAVARVLDIMINERRKQLPLFRVAAFVKRLLSVATIMDDLSALCLLALVRSFFIAHSKLVQLVGDEESLTGDSGGVFRADIDDPDVSNALATSVRLELKMLGKRRHHLLSLFAQSILHSAQSGGPLKLHPELTSVKPWILMEREIGSDAYSHTNMKYIEEIRKKSKNCRQELTPDNLQLHIEHWLHTSS